MGVECERLWTQAKQAREEKAFAQASAESEYGRLIEQVHAVPLEERVGWPDSFAGEALLDDIEGALREAQGADPMSEEAPARLRTIAVSRPYGIRAEIEREVAALATKNYGRLITIRTVRSCWIEVRKLLARLKSDET